MTKNITIKCSDGFSLAGILFQPEQVKGAVLIGPATGIKKEFYTNFASYLCENGYAVLTFENRGIGESKVG
ncbi:MAG: alpha/beta hydrolase, partial [Bacteroidota bacterium]